MSLTQEIRRNTSQGLSPVQKMLYSYPSSGLKLFSIATAHQINDESVYDNFATLIGDIILGFYKIQDTVPLLQQELKLDAKHAALLGAEVLDFLSPLSDINFIVPIQEIDSLLVLGDDLPPKMSNVNIENSPDSLINDTTIPELHTMATDANALRSNPTFQQPEIIHRSEQPDVRKSLSELPSYANQPSGNDPSSAAVAPIEPPRWGN